ncbi:MAG: HTH domain-containing protein [Candidatus Thermoplasmatota archaeon]|nr:HTH domain-containing protein [Candidatus Thermoplasmatota archaeon]
MSREQQILSLLRQSKQKSFTPKEIAETLGINYETVKRTLLRMYRKRIISKSCRGNYHLFERDKKGQKGTTLGNKVTEEKVTKGSIERDKSDRERDKGYITLPVSDARKRTTLDLKNHTIVILNWKKTSLGRSMSDLVDEAVLKQWGKNLTKNP